MSGDGPFWQMNWLVRASFVLSFVLMLVVTAAPMIG